MKFLSTLLLAFLLQTSIGEAVEQSRSPRCQTLVAMLRAAGSDGSHPRAQIVAACVGTDPSQQRYCEDLADRIRSPRYRAQAVFDLQRECVKNGCAMDER